MKHFSGYMHGINLGGWFSQCDHTRERYDTFIREKDFEAIKSWGLDHVRIPVDYDLVEDRDGNYLEEGFAYIQKAIDWCGTYGLNMVLDLHKTFGYSFDSGENESGLFHTPAYQERFCRLWEEFARRFGRFEDRLTFELLNEVTDPADSDSWNALSSECIRRIRAIAPAIQILVGGYHNNGIDALPDLAMPADEHIIYNFHCYEPLIFTHQGAYWIPGMDTSFRMHLDASYREYAENSRKEIGPSGVHTAPVDQFDPSLPLGPEYFEQYIAQAVAVAEERNVALYCGEYGVINLASPEDTLKWYRMICGVFDRFGIGRAAWSYREMDFGLADAHMQDVIEEVRKVL